MNTKPTPPLSPLGSPSCSLPSAFGISSLPPVLDACCGPRMMWVNKQDPRAIYFDRRNEDYEIKPNAAYPNGTTLKVRPDVQGSFTSLPFPDESFRLVVLDPPHFEKLSEETVLGKTYSKLFPDWEDEIRAGFAECFRVLKPEGVLIFKWCSVQVPLDRVLSLAPHPPLFGHNTGHRAQTHWMTFMKSQREAAAKADEKPDGQEENSKLTD